ncbi:hypothetical protein ABIC63_000497 [Pseudacidovorax sp. 1753]|uniref:hypothetical protein n=1 Tax=Pseudacidovorax sp. 1753 TaxID=3156419 RepID=UPI0033942233
MKLDSGRTCRMSGPEVAAATAMMPKAGPDQPKTATVEMDTEWSGRVLVMLECRQFRHYKITHWGWTVVDAVPAPPSAPAAEAQQ